VEKNCHCSKCLGPVEVSIKTVCIASRVILTCTNEDCGFVYNGAHPAPANLQNTDDDRERTTDFAINILYVLGFLSVGDGGTEAARVLGMLSSPNNTTMETRSFPTIEERINTKMERLAEDVLLENLTEEVRLSLAALGIDNSNDFNLWKDSLKSEPAIVLNKSKFPLIDVSFDMGWQQRSSGNRYTSPSGHAILVGSRTRKPVAMMLKSKLCSFCTAWPKNKKNIVKEIGPHTCRRNHQGTSLSMEPAACLEMIVSLFDLRSVIVARICCDDDASTRSLLHWSNADWMLNNNTTERPKVKISKGPNIGKKQLRPRKREAAWCYCGATLCCQSESPSKGLHR
jgi:hypothetical protein